MSLPELAVARPVGVAAAVVGLLLFGSIGLLRMPLALLPEVEIPRLVIWTSMPDAGPAVVARRVSRPIEEALAGVAGARGVESVSRAGQSLVVVSFPWGADMDLAQIHVRERIDGMDVPLPRAAGRPAVLRIDPTARPVLVASLAAEPGARGDVGALAATVFRRRLEQVDGVGRVEVVGGSAREVRVEADPDALEAHGISLRDLSDAIARAGASAGGGTALRGRRRLPVRIDGAIHSVEEVSEAMVRRTPGGGTIRVGDLATIRDTVAEGTAAVRSGGRPSIGLLVFGESGANTVTTDRKVRDALARLGRENPGIRVEVVTGQATYVREAVRNVVWSLLAGGILAFLVLLPFLRDPRWPATIALAIPVSVVAAFAALAAAGISLNVMSLGGLALGVGMLVDASIVVLENVFRLREGGMAPARAAGRGAREVQGAIAASTLTTVAVFGPILWVEGWTGALFGDLALAVTVSLVVSLGVSLTLVPTILARLGPCPARPPSPLRASLERLAATVPALHRRALDSALDRRGAVLGGAAIALALGLVGALLLPRSLLPRIDTGVLTVHLELPPGTPLATTEARAMALDRWLRGRPEVEGTLVRVGRASAAEIAGGDARGPDSAVLDIRLRPGARSSEAVGRALRSAFPDLAGALRVDPDPIGGLAGALGTNPAIEVLAWGADPAAARAAAVLARDRLAGVPVLADVAIDAGPDRPSLLLALDRETIAGHGLEADRVVDAIADRTRGRRATALAAFDREVPVVVRPGGPPPAAERLLAGRVAGVPLRLLARTRTLESPSEIRREGGRVVVPVRAGIARGNVAGALDAARGALAGIPLPPGAGVDVRPRAGDPTRNLRSVGLAFLLALVLVYLVLAAQFESLIQPLVVLLAVPLSLLGALLALALAGRGLDVSSGIGLVVLAGISVNDAIVEVDCVNRLRAGGLGVRTAVREAGAIRLRPILMTTATTVCGLLPMACGSGAGAEIRSGLGLALAGGMLSSTALTLVVVPVLYVLVVERS